MGSPTNDDRLLGIVVLKVVIGHVGVDPCQNVSVVLLLECQLVILGMSGNKHLLTIFGGNGVNTRLFRGRNELEARIRLNRFPADTRISRMRNEKFGIVFKRELIYNFAFRTPHSEFRI